MHHSGHGMDMDMDMNMDLPPFTLGRGLEFSFDSFFLFGSLLGLALYGWGVLRLRRRGDSWPVGRTIGFVTGVLSVALVMCTKLNDYGMVMFSVHMVQHMVISMISPILLLLGAPVTLALRALPPAARGTKGPRELLLMLLHSRYMRIVTHPAFTIPMFIASLYGLYFTPLFDFLMESRTGHIAMMVHFLAVGLIFFWPIMGVDPGPHRPGYVMRMLELFAGMPFHAFFGIALMMASEPMIKTYADPCGLPRHRPPARPAVGRRHRLGLQRDPLGAGADRAGLPVVPLGAARREAFGPGRGPQRRPGAGGVQLVSRLAPRARPVAREPSWAPPWGMTGSVKAMAVTTFAALVAVSTYSVALGSNGWLWFGWVVLGLLTLGMAATGGT